MSEPNLTGLASGMRPKDSPRFRAEEGGRLIYDDDFIFDALLRIDGDFDTGERERYAQWIVDTLNAADARLPWQTQEPLDPDIAEILHKNLWSLYVED